MLEPSVNKVQDLRAYNSIKKRIQHWRFPVCLEKSLFQSQNMLRIQTRRNEQFWGWGWGVVGSLSKNVRQFGWLTKKILQLKSFNPNLGGRFRGLFCGELWCLSTQTYVVSENVPFSTKTSLILSISADHASEIRLLNCYKLAINRKMTMAS